MTARPDPDPCPSALPGPSRRPPALAVPPRKPPARHPASRPPRRPRRGLWRDTCGAAAVEFALIGLPLVLLVFGLIEFGRALHVRTALDNAADHAQRALLIDPEASMSDLSVLARAHFAAGDDTALGVTVTDQSANGRDYRVIALTYEMQLLLPAPLGRSVSLGMERQVLVP